MYALRLSTDTCSTLSEYLPTGLSREFIRTSLQVIQTALRPTKILIQTSISLKCHNWFLKHSPKRAKHFLPSHKRRYLSHHQLSDLYLDSPLEKSVHALETSNTLLQSSISTQTRLSAVLALDSPMNFTLEDCVHNLSSRITDYGGVQASWADDFQEVSNNVEGLSREDTSHGRRNSVHPIRREHIRREHGPSSSLDIRQASVDIAVKNHFHYSPHSRAHLIAPPQILTQYVTSSQDSGSILLPSTHSSPSSLYHTSDWKPLPERISSSSTNLLSISSLPPKLTDRPLEHSTPAYTMLSSFVYRAPSSPGPATPSSFTTSFMSRRSNGSASTERGHDCTRRSSLPASLKSLDTSSHHCCETWSVCVSGLPDSLLIEKHVVPPTVLHRPMTPPVEESSSSSDSCAAKTVQSLRKILDQDTLQPEGQSEDNGVSGSSIYRSRLRAPPFLPRSPAPVAVVGTSTATASISRLLTKGTHSFSTRAPSPRQQSAMKRSPSSSASSTRVAPTPLNSTLNTPLTLSFPEVVVKILGGCSTPSSGMSTSSKRISFAELPESYASTKPNGGSSSKFKDKDKQRKRKNGLAGGRGQDQSSAERTGCWNGCLTGGSLTMLLARQEERVEERTSRNWGGRMGTGFSNRLDDWAI